MNGKDCRSSETGKTTFEVSIHELDIQTRNKHSSGTMKGSNLIIVKDFTCFDQILLFY